MGEQSLMLRQRREGRTRRDILMAANTETQAVGRGNTVSNYLSSYGSVT
jgi:hypothetical protein